MINQHRSFFTSALASSAKFALAACSMIALNAAAHAESAQTNGAVGLTAATYTVSESAGTVTLSAIRGGGKTGAISVTYTTLNNSAIAGKAYTAKSGTLTWANGDAANKTFTIPITNTDTTGTKDFFVRLKAVGSTILGAHSSATVDIISSTSSAAPKATKSIKQWGVACNDSTDETSQLRAAIDSAANNAFTLIIDCPVRFHTGAGGGSPIAVPDGVTVAFQGSGELLTGGVGLTIAHVSEVTFINYNIDIL